MQILFAISILSLLVLVGAGVAAARHIRVSRELSETPSPPERSFAAHLIQAAEQPSLSEPRIVLNQSIRDITALKSWNQPAEAVTLHPGHGTRPELHRIVAESLDPSSRIRKAPQTAQQSGAERLDWAYFNKDLGDLTDPYETPRLRANSGISPRRF